MKYKRELRLRDVITIESQTAAYRGKIGHVHQEMINRKGEICAVGDLTIGLFDMRSRRLVSPTREWLEAVGHDSSAEAHS